MDDARSLWSKALRGMALILLGYAGVFWMIYSGWLVVSREDLGMSWTLLLVPLGLALLLWLAAWVLRQPRDV